MERDSPGVARAVRNVSTPAPALRVVQRDQEAGPLLRARRSLPGACPHPGPLPLRGVGGPRWPGPALPATPLALHSAKRGEPLALAAQEREADHASGRRASRRRRRPRGRGDARGFRHELPPSRGVARRSFEAACPSGGGGQGRVRGVAEAQVARAAQPEARRVRAQPSGRGGSTPEARFRPGLRASGAIHTALSFSTGRTGRGTPVPV